MDRAEEISGAGKSTATLKHAILLTPETIRWLNENYQEKKIEDTNFIGTQVEDVMNTTCCYPRWKTEKGDIQIRKQPFYSMFGLVMPLDALHILEDFGSVCYSAKWMNGEGAHC